MTNEDLSAICRHEIWSGRDPRFVLSFNCFSKERAVVWLSSCQQQASHFHHNGVIMSRVFVQHFTMMLIDWSKQKCTAQGIAASLELFWHFHVHLFVDIQLTCQGSSFEVNNLSVPLSHDHQSQHDSNSQNACNQ